MGKMRFSFRQLHQTSNTDYSRVFVYVYTICYGNVYNLYVHTHIYMGFLGGSVVKNLPAKQEMQVRSLGQEEPLEEEMATHCSALAWKMPWTEEPGGLQSMGSQRIRYDLATKQQHIYVHLIHIYIILMYNLTFKTLYYVFLK